MRKRITVSLCFALQFLACARLAVTVKARAGHVPVSASSLDAQSEIPLLTSWSSLDDYIQHLDELKRDGADALLRLYHDHGRERVRMGFRRFRDTVAAEAAFDDSSTASPWAELQAGACMHLEKHDLFGLDSYGDLRGLLGTAFLGRLKIDRAASFNVDLPKALDSLTKLAFFEFGVALEGSSDFTVRGDVEIMSSEVDWKVIHERNEPADLQEGDRGLVQFRLRRERKSPAEQMLEIGAVVGFKAEDPGNFEPLPAMELRYDRSSLHPGETSQLLTLRKGYRAADGEWAEITSSRRLALTQSLSAGDLLALVETNFYGLRGENTRSFRIDLRREEICAVLKEEMLQSSSALDPAAAVSENTDQHSIQAEAAAEELNQAEDSSQLEEKIEAVIEMYEAENQSLPPR